MDDTEADQGRDAAYLADCVLKVDNQFGVAEVNHGVTNRYPFRIPILGQPLSDIFELSDIAVAVLQNSTRSDLYGEWFETTISAGEQSQPVAVALLPASGDEQFRIAVSDQFDRRNAQRRLARLHDFARVLTRTDNPERLATEALHTVVGATDTLSGRMYLISGDEQSQWLEAVSTVGDATSYPERVTERESIIWDAFQRSQPRYRSNGTATPGEAAVFELFVPVGSFGVLVLWIPSSEQIRLERYDQTSIITSLLTLALDRLKDIQLATDYDGGLPQQQDQHPTGRRLHELLRDTNRAIIDAGGISDLYSRVSDTLTTEAYASVWISEYDSVPEKLRHVRWSGGVQPLEHETKLNSDVSMSDPYREATEQQSVAVRSAQSFDDWTTHEATDGDAVSSVAVVPIVYNDIALGAVTILSTTEFAEYELTVLDDIVSLLGYAIVSRVGRSLEQTGENAFLQVRVRDTEHPLVKVAQAAREKIAVEYIEPDSVDGIKVYFEVAEERLDAVLGLAGDIGSIAHSEVVGARSNRTLVSLDLRDGLSPTLLSMGLHIQSVQADETGLLADLEVPPDIPPRGLLAMLKRRFTDVSLTARGRAPTEGGTVGRMRRFVRESLTERQYEVLRCAFRNGYYNWPRTNSARDVAEVLEISQPTFSQHLRAAENKLLEALFTPNTA